MKGRNPQSRNTINYHKRMKTMWFHIIMNNSIRVHAINYNHNSPMGGNLLPNNHSTNMCPQPKNQHHRLKINHHHKIKDSKNYRMNK